MKYILFTDLLCSKVSIAQILLEVFKITPT